MRRWPVIVVAAAALGALSGAVAYQQTVPRQGEQKDSWQEVAWPFPRDGWPAGRAFRCRGALCGDGIEVYVRPKIGFCNCDRGVADDDEVDRVTDVDLISESFVPLAPGEIVHVADMAGRTRAYDLKLSDSLRRVAIGIAVSRRCDLLVAVAHGNGDAPEVRRAALALLATREMTRWMMAAMDER
ncbi:hypothetical protein [Bradyrhizobium sp. sBnM-33]|uniref:hypothetical protein n=1 Tax=Bradyrhizobium sp. sBnM-33 TaxID=2831780 RepID=UPI001BCE2A97|nr:hypothetical protein [Bradyrhizobium sp. sBnM-33]WOH51795.1 hypothetical protein RX328_05830 [Bradyrhizobium sp. sBnM-33]